MDDLISRQAVLDMAYDMSEIDGEHFEDTHMVVDVDDIHELPSAEKTGHETVTEFADRCRECGKTRKGHWIIMGGRYIKCSECGHITKTESPDIYNFCMVCGIHMSENPTYSESEGKNDSL